MSLPMWAAEELHRRHLAETGAAVRQAAAALLAEIDRHPPAYPDPGFVTRVSELRAVLHDPHPPIPLPAGPPLRAADPWR